MRDYLRFAFKFCLQYFFKLLGVILITYFLLIIRFDRISELWGAILGSRFDVRGNSVLEGLWYDVLTIILLIFIFGFLPLFIAIYLVSKGVFRKPKLIFIYLPLVTVFLFSVFIIFAYYLSIVINKLIK